MADREDANLIARRSAEVPVTRWLVAHSDTKAQGHSMAGRLVAVYVLLLATMVLLGASLWRLAGPLPAPMIAAAAALAVTAGYLASRGRLAGHSPGARDNGSGLVALLVAAAETTDPAVGVIVTGAEEFGLIGSRILSQRSPALFRGAQVINFDTLDDHGPWRVVSHDARGESLAAAMAARLGIGGRPRAAASVAGRHPGGFRAAGRAGADAVTLARLDWDHPPADPHFSRYRRRFRLRVSGRWRATRLPRCRAIDLSRAPGYDCQRIREPREGLFSCGAGPAALTRHRPISRCSIPRPIAWSSSAPNGATRARASW